MNKKAIKELNISQGLDGGGYTFENPPRGLRGLACVVWGDPDPDYIPWCTGDDSGSARHAFYGLPCPVYVFAPNSGHFSATVWPKSYKVKKETFVLVRDGHLHETDHECHCHGKLVEWTGAAGEPLTPLSPTKVVKWLSLGKAEVETPTQTKKPKFFWDCMGSPSDKPYPDCDRCEGDGYVNSTGGEWALYALQITEEP